MHFLLLHFLLLHFLLLHFSFSVFLAFCLSALHMHFFWLAGSSGEVGVVQQVVAAEHTPHAGEEVDQVVVHPGEAA